MELFDLVTHRRSIRQFAIRDVEQAKIDRIVQTAGLETDEDGHFRAPLELLVGEAAPAPLNSVAFLRGFAEPPRVVPRAADREALRSLQPLASTLWNSKPRSLLAMAHLLSEASCFDVCVGQADETAAVLEAAVAAR